MTEESHAAMTQALDAVKLDADMRAMAENAMQHFASVTAEPSAAQVIDESQAGSGSGGVGGGMDAPTGMTVAPMVPEPYHPVSPFRLKFTFGSDGSYSGVTMEDPKFLWNEPDTDGNPDVSLKTAGIGTIGLNGTIYLNITLSGEDGAKKFASAQVSMSSDGDISIPLYQLDTTKGVVKDYRHALISLCAGGGGGGGARIPGNFEPTFEADPSDNNTVKLAHVGEGYVPFGRRFYWSGRDSHLHDSAKISTGMIYLEVVHPTSSSTPQFLVKGESSSSVDFTQASTNVSLIPLYKIANGKMILDYRSCMSLTVREV